VTFLYNTRLSFGEIAKITAFSLKYLSNDVPSGDVPISKNLSKDKYFHKLFEVGRFHWAPVECGNLYNLIS
jgi:hypothetical protein